MSETRLAFVWHMHQPYYRDMVTGGCFMPWARLHGTHSYYDMLKLYEQFPNSRGTINFVPSLVDQLMAYVEGGATDAFLENTKVPAAELTSQQKIFILRHFFSANAHRKIAPYGLYKKLYDRLGCESPPIDYDQAVRFFSAQDYLNLQVFFNLVWFGFQAREEIPDLERMLLRGDDFTEEDKAFVLDSQRRILANLIEAIGRAARSDNVEITTTPYFHPILPLLIDTDIAKRSMPKAELPVRFQNAAAAHSQLTLALDSMERWFGTRPSGIWPAEGSVCPEMIPIFADAGVKWMATDDMVLRKSFKGSKHVDIHTPYLAGRDGAEVAMVFRDHGLANLLSFTYANMDADEAVEDFLKHIKTISQEKRDDTGLVTVILDGENPWEFYPDSGREFLKALFSAIEEQGMATTRVCDHLRDFPPSKRIEELHSGSWIDANFGIWIGKPEENKGWEYIRRTANELGESLSPEALEGRGAQAYRSFLAACGSDWFWWFDDDFDSPFKGDFDRIFRGHLKNAFTLLGREIPLFLFDPIYRFEDAGEAFIEPPGFVRPTIDGANASFFEWANASRISVHGRTTGAMAASSIDPFETISFGFNPRAFFLRIEPVDRDGDFSLPEDEHLAISLHWEGRNHRFMLRSDSGTLALSAVDEDGNEREGYSPSYAAKEILEIGFDFEGLGLRAGEQATLTIALHRRGIEVRRYSHIKFLVPSADYEAKMWRV